VDTIAQLSRPIAIASDPLVTVERRSSAAKSAFRITVLRLARYRWPRCTISRNCSPISCERRSSQIMRVNRLLPAI
jgi:hypothetical protein